MTTLTDLIGLTPSPPGPIADHSAAVTEWSLGGNDKYGDCVLVAPSNQVDLTKAIAGSPQIVSEAEAEYWYAKETGWSPLDAATDKGDIVETMLNDWSQNGWAADPVYKPVGWCAITQDQIHQAIWSLGAVIGTCLLPMDANGDPDFTDAALTVDARPEDGHCVLLVRSAPEGYQCVTWAEKRSVSAAWWARFGDGLWAVRLPDWRVK